MITMYSIDNLDQAYKNLTQEDYRYQHLAQPGRWHGVGAKMLGLKGAIQPEQVRQMLKGNSPDGRSVYTGNIASKYRKVGCGIDACSSPSLRLLWATAPDKVRRVIEKSQREAAESAMGYLAYQVSHLKSAHCLWATFQRSASESRTPNLTTRAILFQLPFRAESQQTPLNEQELKALQPKADRIYRTELAEKLGQRLGLVVESRSLRVEGIPENIADRVRPEWRSFGQTLGRIELFESWRKGAEQQGWGPKQTEAFLSAQKHNIHKGHQMPQPKQNYEGLLVRTKEKLTSRLSQSH